MGVTNHLVASKLANPETMSPAAPEAVGDIDAPTASLRQSLWDKRLEQRLEGLPRKVVLDRFLTSSSLTPESVTRTAREVLSDAGLTAEKKAERISTEINSYLGAKGLEGSATPKQIRAFVRETLKHLEAMKEIGLLRGLDWRLHDIADETSKFNPEIAAGLAKPRRDAQLLSALQQHEAASHHATWVNPRATIAELAEGASDIVNAWRMVRCYKKAWTFNDIAKHLARQLAEGRLSQVQKQALEEAIPFQREFERRMSVRGSQ